MRRGTLLLLPALLPTGLVLTVGLGSVAAQSLGLMPLVGSAQLSTAAYRAAVADPGVLDGLRVSLGIAASSTAIALLLGTAVALLVLRSRRAGRVLRLLAASTVPVPHLIGAVAVGLLLADSGLVARLLGAEPGTFPPLVAGPWWVAVVAEYAWKEAAFVALVLVAVLASREPDLDEAAATLGAAPVQRLRRVTLPLAAPALVATGGISFAYVLGSYEVAWLLGRTYPEPLPVLAYRLYTSIDLTLRAQASAVALLTVALTVLALLVSVRLLRRTAVLR